MTGPRRPDPDRPKPKPEAPDRGASVEAHRKHAEEFLLREEHKKMPPGFQEKNDEAKP